MRTTVRVESEQVGLEFQQLLAENGEPELPRFD